ncbi:hypothetical protein CDAR_73661 [Caerostris darwini]|uniref:Uncharacterized protein n=1 Tax=Caerostris darwini TaxID=1538125 RepID=A0AAV4MV68_9ARAC|nr:hypothetical protein CDAR_73661 [Caerostris darwini]
MTGDRILPNILSEKRTKKKWSVNRLFNPRVYDLFSLLPSQLYPQPSKKDTDPKRNNHHIRYVIDSAFHCPNPLSPLTTNNSSSSSEFLLGNSGIPQPPVKTSRITSPLKRQLTKQKKPKSNPPSQASVT